MKDEGLFLGCAHIKQEGAPLHPDDMDCDMSEEAYNRYLTAYYDHHYDSHMRGEIEFDDPKNAHPRYVKDFSVEDTVVQWGIAGNRNLFVSESTIEIYDPKGAFTLYTPGPSLSGEVK